eukprot:CAMPEP_0203966420 /NCGR_PEP_ID=MMETSP0359-20131031/95665_1 /ASSEMBLY_ACC=CAM_ASM_000338 /TAXON_ID=268821 /ORGANISM="Scrippsiella Hangoei, Strain SHTV-5" /LENGTH=60 /DNA_ID=CAMNT_0050903803 /DNA_START=81 /DNA_END=263 /DNA_ORIENTATION=-
MGKTNEFWNASSRPSDNLLGRGGKQSIKLKSTHMRASLKCNSRKALLALLSGRLRDDDSK